MTRLDRRPGLVAALAALALTLTGCGAGAAGDAGAAAKPPVKHRGAARHVSATPSLPAGDPGPDALSVPDPGTAGAEPQATGARRVVPAEALLGPTDVAEMLGGQWASADPGVVGDEECTTPTRAVGRGTVGVVGPGGTVVETVTTHRGARGADAAVAALRPALTGCGWALGADPRLGTSSLAATKDGAQLAAVAADGVVAVVTGSGPKVDGFAWSGLVDMALGTSCAAAVEGCH